MSSPMIWIVIPGLAAIVLSIFQRWNRAVLIASISLALLLAWLAWQLPVGESFSLRLWAGFPSFKVDESLTILERRLFLDNAKMPMLILIYLGLAFWLGGAYTARTDRLFPGLSFGIIALLTASVAVESSQYAALTIVLVALLCVPILSPPGKPIGRGISRFLVFQILGACLILFSDAYLTTSGGEPSRNEVIRLAVSLTSLGFALVLAVFPFHTWFPMLGETGNPYANAFVFFILSTTVSLSILENLNRFTLLGASPDIYPLIRSAGVLMALTGGLWAIFDRHLGRILGFAATTQIGTGLLAISLGNEASNNSFFAGLFFTNLVPYSVGMAVWSQALTALQTQTSSLGLLSTRGLARRLPLATASLVLANFSLAGLPLLASFPINLALWLTLAQVSPPSSLLSMLGSVGLLGAGLMTFAALLNSPAGQDEQISGADFQPERGFQTIILVLGCIALFIVGLTPHWLSPYLSILGGIYSSSGP